MSKTLCKGIRKDGSACQGNALDQYDGLCIAHGPPANQAHQWRSQGGKNSSTAARLDKRIPENLKQAIDLVQDCMIQVKEGKMTPAACNAICRGAQTLIALLRRSDEEMDLIRTEEIQAAAAAYLGLNANLDVLEAADDMAARQNKHRREALVEQDYAEVKEPFKPGQPPEVFLNHKGRRRFGYQTIENTQEFLNELDDELTEFDPWQSDLSEITDLLQTMQEHVEETLSALARNDVAPFDPLTGQSITELPTGVQTRSKLDRPVHDEVKPQERLQEQLSMITQLLSKAEELAQDEDHNQEPEVAASYGQEPVVAATYRPELELAATYGPELELAETYSQELEVAETNGQEPEVAPTYGQEPEEAATCGQELEAAATSAQEPEEAATYGQEPEAAQQGSGKLAYIQECLKASGVPVESVPAHFRWQ